MNGAQLASASAPASALAPTATATATATHTNRAESPVLKAAKRVATLSEREWARAGVGEPKEKVVRERE